MKKLALVLALALAACGGGTDPTKPTGPGEPNGDATQATPVVLGTPVAGTVTSASDADWYRLTLAAPARVRIRTFDRTGAACDPANSAVDTYVEVKDAAGAPLTVCDQGTGFRPCDGNDLDYCEDFTLDLPTGDAYVVVTGNPPFPFDYTLSVTEVVANPADPGEPNDTIGQASPIALGTPVAGSIASAADADWYKVTLAAPATVRIQTFDRTGLYCDPANGAVDTFVEVRDAAGSPVTTCEPGNAFQPCDNNAIDFCEDFALPLPAGDSYVVVTGNPPFPFDYVLSVGDVPTDVHEPNDGPALATPLALDTPAVGVASSYTDLDYYRLTLDAPAAIRIQTFDATGLGCDPSVDTYVEVFDANGTDLTRCAGQSVFPCDDTALATCEDFTIPLAAGDSYVVVTAAAPTMPAFAYTVSVSLAPP